MIKDQHATILFIAAMAGLMVAKAVFFPCNCEVEQPQAHVSANNDSTRNVLNRGMVTMIDLGADSCIPCKMMTPIIDELKIEYAGRADIIFIDVSKNPDQARNYGIRSIPTQIFFDKTGKEVFRNTGFMDRKRIVGILSELGIS